VKERTLPNAVALPCTPDSATLPAPKHVPLPATEYVRPVVDDSATTTQKPSAATATSPFGMMPGCAELPKAALVPATPRNVPVAAPVPMTVVMTPVDKDSRRTRRLPKSVQYANEASAARPCGKLSIADVAAPPSPLKPRVPFPATLRTLQIVAGELEGEGVGVVVPVPDGEGTCPRQLASHRNARTTCVPASVHMISATPVSLRTVRPYGEFTVALTAAAPLPDVLQVPDTPASARITPAGEMQRTTQDENSPTHTVPSPSAVRPMGA